MIFHDFFSNDSWIHHFTIALPGATPARRAVPRSERLAFMLIPPRETHRTTDVYGTRNPVRCPRLSHFPVLFFAPKKTVLSGKKNPQKRSVIRTMRKCASRPICWNILKILLFSLHFGTWNSVEILAALVLSPVSIHIIKSLSPKKNSVSQDGIDDICLIFPGFQLFDLFWVCL